MHDGVEILKATEQIAERIVPRFPASELEAFVRSFVERRESFLDLAAGQGTPLYVLDSDVLCRRARRFLGAFRSRIPSTRAFFAVKSNNCPAIARVLVGAGFGLDVSSGLELRLALDAGAQEIVFSGPGKTDDELAAAVANEHRVVVLLDSFAELGRLDRLATAAGRTMRCGVRLTTDERGLWRKFGIPLAELEAFMREADRAQKVRLCGLQFHTSWNLGPENQTAFLRRLGTTLAELSPVHRAQIDFLDIGGGFWPPQGEWLQCAGTDAGRTVHSAMPCDTCLQDHYRIPAEPIETFVNHIHEALTEHVWPHVECAIWAEPGRWICNDAMHILLTVIDRKAEDIAITDGGTNAVGWERFETDYFPLINLTRPALAEHACYVFGALCTPHDVWGYGYWGEDIRPGDRLIVPTQGAYTYSLRQEFIKPLPRVVVI